MSDATAPTVMIVGDDEDFQYLMRRYVTESGCRALVGQRTAESLAIVGQEKPAAVFLEIGPPGMAGRDTLRMLKQDGATRDIPVIVCFWLEEEAQALSEPVASYLQKPILYRDVLAALVDVGVTAVAGPLDKRHPSSRAKRSGVEGSLDAS
jgi:CheY-like chemotaxis protein